MSTDEISWIATQPEPENMALKSLLNSYMSACADSVHNAEELNTVQDNASACKWSTNILLQSEHATIHEHDDLDLNSLMAVAAQQLPAMATAAEKLTTAKQSMQTAPPAPCWHKIRVRSHTNPLTGHTVLLVMQSDVTEMVEAQEEWHKVCQARWCCEDCAG
jgi:hypothetical protein